jgi:hypothetical protein
MAEILPLRDGQPVVDEIKDLLEKAERGELTSIAFAYTTPTGSYGTGWNGQPGTPGPLMAAVVALYRRYAAFLFD